LARIVGWHPAEGSSPETLFVAAALRHIEQTKEHDSDFANLFWQVIRVRCLLYRHVVQRPLTPGLQWFVRFFPRIKPLRKGISDGLLASTAARICGKDAGLHSLEVRLGTEDGVSACLKKVRQVEEAIFPIHDSGFGSLRPHCSEDKSQTSRLEVGVLFHFSRKRGGGWESGGLNAYGLDHSYPGTVREHSGKPLKDAGNPTGCRFARFYSKQRRHAQALVSIFQKHPRTLRTFRGIDLCTDEAGVPIWVMAPLIRWVREAGQQAASHLKNRGELGIPPPRLSTHAGEDFVHLLTGLRRLDEAISYLRLEEGDRLGHGLALGVDPLVWCSRVGRVLQTREERLLDLAWEWRCYAEYSEYGIAVTSDRLAYVRTEISRLARSIFDRSYYPEDLMSHPLLNTTTMFVDTIGRLTQRTDSLGHLTKYQYNNLNQLIQITDPLQGIGTLTYDLDGNLQTVQDARQQGTNNKTVYTYDNFDHLQTRTDPLMRQEAYVFDQLNNLTSFTDRRGKVATYQYDGINRRTFAGYGTLPGPTYESTVNYTYDGGNRLTKIVDSSSGTITPVFDGLDRLTSETTPQGSVAYQYDNDSRLQTATVSGQPTVNYYFDNASRLYKVAQGSTSTLIGYDNANRRTSLTLPNGIVLTYGYDNDSRINSMSYLLGTTSVGTLGYQYDAVGRRTQVGGSLAATGFPQAMTLATYDVANELTNWNGTTISSDANGNILNDGAAAYTWNARNQLVSRGSLSFQYDSYGRRILNAAGNSLLYEGWNAGQELSGTTPVANRILGGMDEFFTRTDSTGTYSPITDVLGSVLALTNSSGNFATQYGYDPYGNTTNTGGGSSANVFEYTGRENDGNGLYYYRARYYSPTLHRFVSEDPIGAKGGSLNFYQYVQNDPADNVDPSGLQYAQSWAAAGATAGLALTAGGSLVVDVGTGGLNVLATPAELAAGTSIGGVIGYAAGSALDYVIQFNPSNPGAFPDPLNPPAGWLPAPNGKPDTWKDPDSDWWHWHDDPAHGPPHWDVGFGKSSPWYPDQWWWPKGGKPGPKPPGNKRPCP
jgi:RHS repeat-associated protein